MPEPTIKQQEERAFKEWWKGAIAGLHSTGRRSPYYAESLCRRAWFAALQRGEEKHGCCTKATVTWAKPRPFEEG